MESPPAPGSDRRRPPTPSAAASPSPPNGNQAGAGNIASGSGTTAGSQSSVSESEGGHPGPGVVDPKYPLWAYVQRVVTEPGTASTGSRGGNIKFICNFCHKTYPGTYSRVKAHLLQIKKKDVATCDKITHPAFEQLCKENRAANELIEHGITRHTLPLPPYVDSGPSRKRKQTAIGDSFNAEVRQQADAHIARMFFTTGQNTYLSV